LLLSQIEIDVESLLEPDILTNILSYLEDNQSTKTEAAWIINALSYSGYNLQFITPSIPALSQLFTSSSTLIELVIYF